MNEPSSADPLASTGWLADRLDDPGVRVIDATWFMPNSGRDAPTRFLAAHIPGAGFFDIDRVADTSTGLPHMLPPPEMFAAQVEPLGVASDTLVIAYDDNGLMASARLWWMFRAMGHDRVKVLDGGMALWRAEGWPMEAGPARSAPRKALFAPSPRPELVRSFDQVRSQTRRVLDARPGARFRGEAAEPRPGLRSGHMPGASSLPHASLLSPDGRLKPVPDLRHAFSDAGIEPKPGLTTSCGSGVTACILALALARLGVWDTAVYDGSWAEWGARADAPVVTGS